MVSSTWDIARISQILPLDEEALHQILDYASTLSKPAAAEHLKDILGDSPLALEFISTFNARRDVQASVQAESAPPSSDPPSRKSKKKKAPLNRLPAPRVPEDHGNTSGAYTKKAGEDYMSAARRPGQELSSPANTVNSSENPNARQTKMGKPPPSASGPLISDLPNVRTSHIPSSAPKTKIHVSGGPSMHGASATLQDLDSAIRTLELQTNPSRSSSPSARRCDCLATRHPLLTAAPNCLNCGKIICVKEGVGPCTFCSHPLLSPAEVSSMIRALREERGFEKTSLNNASHRRADVSQTARPFATPPTSSAPEPSAPSGASAAETTLNLARQHRDNLLAFQRENARRTHIIDEAADFETPTSGLSMWSSPVQRAEQLKRQQKVLREQEWNAKPEYEKRKVVVSVDLVGGKVVRRMATVERPKDPEDINPGMMDGEASLHAPANRDSSHGAFSKNPLLGELIRPVWKGGENEQGSAKNETDEPEKSKRSTWRRVQDDTDDNEAWILDGGIYGGKNHEEPDCRVRIAV